jgi:NADH-quinone oxidoreductase subunit J
MVLFLFVIMMLDLGHPEKARRPGSRDWWPAVFLGGVTLTAAFSLVAAHPPANPAGAAFGVRDFATVLFRRYGVAVEVISMQLLFALVGALYLGRRQAPSPQTSTETDVKPPLTGGGGRPDEGDA